jgi:hypothetical protein
MTPKVYRVTLKLRDDVNDLALWVIARTPEHAIKRARNYVRRVYEEKRPELKGSVLVGTIDVP